jgi:hypothetical protein
VKISIGFSEHNGNFLSKIICFVLGTKYSHVYIRRQSKYGEYVYQASGLQVNFMNIATFLSSNTIIEEYEFNLTPEQNAKALQFGIKYAGRPYNLKALFQISAMLICVRLGRKVNFKGDGDSSFICSELGEAFCKEVLELDIPVDQDFISPKDLEPYIAKYGKRII